MTCSAASSRIVLAAPITLAEIETRFAVRIEDRDAVTFDNGSASLRARRTRRLGAVVLAEQIKPVAPDAGTARTLAEGIVRLGLDKLPWSKAALQFRTRVEFLRKAEGDEWPDLSDQGLANSAADWLEPILIDKTSRGAVGADEISDAVMNALPWQLRRRHGDEGPAQLTTPP